MSPFFVTCICMFVLPLIMLFWIWATCQGRKKLCVPTGCGLKCINDCKRFNASRKDEEYEEPDYSGFDLAEYEGQVVAEMYTSFVVGLFLIHPNLMDYNFKLLSCIQVSPNDYLLLADTSFACYTPEHTTWIFALFLPFLVLWTVGIPMMAWKILYPYRELLYLEGDEAFNNPERRKIDSYYQFLYQGYGGHFWYWEVVVMLRKIGLTGVAVFFSGDPTNQVLIAVLVVLFAFGFHLYNRPYVSETGPNARRLDDMEAFSLATACVTFVLGQFTFVIEEGTPALSIITIVIIGVNCAFYLVIFWRIFFAFKSQMDLAKEKAQKVIEDDLIEMMELNLAESCSVCGGYDGPYDNDDYYLCSNHRDAESIAKAKAESATNEIVKPTAVMATINEDIFAPTQKEKVKKEKVYVKATADFVHEKKNKMNFQEGDVIEVLDTSGKWHLGRLVKSSKYPITEENNYFPPNFVVALSAEDAQAALADNAPVSRI